jgi:hypothetical protein
MTIFFISSPHWSLPAPVRRPPSPPVSGAPQPHLLLSVGAGGRGAAQHCHPTKGGRGGTGHRRGAREGRGEGSPAGIGRGRAGSWPPDGEGSSLVEGKGGSPAELEQAIGGATRTTVAGLTGGGGGRLAGGAREGRPCRAI